MDKLTKEKIEQALGLLNGFLRDMGAEPVHLGHEQASEVI